MLDPVVTLNAARRGDEAAFAALTEPHRHELQVRYYRMLGSLHDAEDVVQETLLHAWRRLETFEARASFRAWLYKIATNACLDLLDKQNRRKLTPPVSDAQNTPNLPLAEMLWLEPFPDEMLPETNLNIEARYSQRESIKFAFLTAIQLLPPRQRAILILRDVLDWQADEVAHLLETTVSAVNSALHRARATLDTHYKPEAEINRMDEQTRQLLKQYIEAWETADIAKLVALLKEDAIFTMPPAPLWFRGRAAIGVFLRDIMANQSWRLLLTAANAQPAFGLYQYDEDLAVYRAVSLHVLSVDEHQIAQ